MKEQKNYLCEKRWLSSVFVAQNQCVLNSTLVFAQVLICQKRNCFSCISFKGNWNKYKNTLESTPQPHQKHTLAFDQGMATSMIMRNLQDCFKICITLPSKYTCYSYPTSFFSATVFTVLTVSFICQDQSENQQSAELKPLLVCIDCFLVQYAMQIDLKKKKND